MSLNLFMLDGGRAFLEDYEDFKSSVDSTSIVFRKVDANAKELVLVTYGAFNAMGVDWTGFRMELASGATNGIPDYVFGKEAVGGGDGLYIESFTQFEFYNSHAGLLLSGETISPSGSPIWLPGGRGTANGLVLKGNTRQSVVHVDESSGRARTVVSNPDRRCRYVDDATTPAAEGFGEVWLPPAPDNAPRDAGGGGPDAAGAGHTKKTSHQPRRVHNSETAERRMDVAEFVAWSGHTALW